MGVTQSGWAGEGGILYTTIVLLGSPTVEEREGESNRDTYKTYKTYKVLL